MSPYTAKLGLRQTRLARILPGQWSDSLQCTLAAHDIDKPTSIQYKALSYVWGSSKVLANITIDNKVFSITVNLACALRHLRNTESPIIIWIDALCIDQTNIEDRNNQVPLMRDIYAGAEEVFVFLGDGVDHRIRRDYITKTPSWRVTFGNDSTDGEHLDRFRSSWPSLCGNKSWKPFCTICLVRVLAHMDDCPLETATIVKADDHSLVQIFELLRGLVVAPWWRRIWVVQEIAVARKVTLRYGNVTAPWNMIVQAAHAVSSAAKQPKHPLRVELDHSKVLSLFSRQVREIESLRRRWRLRGGHDLLSILQEFSGRSAKDDRDKVYALLGLTHDKALVRPDYSATVYEVYRRTLLVLIEKSHSLAAITGDLRRKNNQKLPSWVPDWSAIVEQSDRDRMVLQSVYNTCGRWQAVPNESDGLYREHICQQLELLVQSLIQIGQPRRRVATRLWGALATFQCFLEAPGVMARIATDMIYLWTFHPGHRKVGYTISQCIEPEILTGAYSYEIKPKNIIEGLLSRSFDRDEACKEVAPDLQGLSHTGMENSFLLLERIFQLGQEDNDLRIRDSCTKLLELLVRDDGLGNDPPESRIETKEFFTFSPITCGGEAAMEKSILRHDFPKTTLWSSLDWDRPFSQYIKAVIEPPSAEKRRTLRTDSMFISEVMYCGNRLITWNDVDSSLLTVGQWLQTRGLNERGHDTSKNSTLRYARALVGGICQKKNRFVKLTPGDEETLLRWFRFSLMPRLRRAIDRSPRVKILGDVVLPMDEAEMKAEAGLIGRAETEPEKSFDKEMQLVTEGRSFFSTKNGQMGLGPASMLPGDEVHILPGGQAPFVLRPLPGTKLTRFEMIGDCFLDLNVDSGIEVPEPEMVPLKGSLPAEILGLMSSWSDVRDHSRRPIWIR